MEMSVPRSTYGSVESDMASHSGTGSPFHGRNDNRGAFVVVVVVSRSNDDDDGAVVVVPCRHARYG